MGLISFTEDTEPTHLDEKIQWKERPETHKKAAPKSEALVKENSTKKDSGVLSLTYEQVNDNADELIELRGAGRYFGVTDPSTGESINAQQELGPLCDNCHKRGHIRAKCKTVICHKCGVVGDHYETQCPTTIVCSRCGERGHTWAACTSKTRKQQYCKTCDVYNHSDDNCPSIWRSYLTITCKQGVKLPKCYCYNCGGDTHYGDECPEQRTSRIPNISGSAFSGNNLPKELRNEYFDRFAGKKTRGFTEPSSKNFSSNKDYGNSYGNDYNYNDNYSNHYGNSNNNGYSNIYNNGYHGNSDYSNSYHNSSGGGKKRSFQSTQKESSKNYEPTRSGFLASKTSTKKSKSSKLLQASRSGVLPRKPKASGSKPSSTKPNRSGVISNGKKQGKKSMQQMY